MAVYIKCANTGEELRAFEIRFVFCGRLTRMYILEKFAFVRGLYGGNCYKYFWTYDIIPPGVHIIENHVLLSQPCITILSDESRRIYIHDFMSRSDWESVSQLTAAIISLTKENTELKAQVELYKDTEAFINECKEGKWC